MASFATDQNATGNVYEGTFRDISGSTYLERDSNNLARLGKIQVLKRRFGFLSICGFSCCILATWETALALFQEALDNGGPAGLAWGFPIAWLCSLSVYLCLAEMASIAPIAGGQYFWVAIFAPRQYKRFCSYLTGWLTVIAWIATLAVGCIFTGTIIQGLLILNYPTYVPQNWHGTLLGWAVIAVSLVVNTVIAGLLPFLEGLILLVHVLGFIAILIVLVYFSPHSSVEDVFFRALNEGGWSTQGLSYCVGFIGNVATFVGADAAVHMAEEIENAALNVPRAIATTVILNGATGWGMVLAILFCIGDLESVVESATGFPFIQVFANSTGNVGASIMTSVVIVLIWCAVIGFSATASRMTWSFARDHGLPFYRFIEKVDKRTRVPMLAVGIVSVIPCLLMLIYIGSPTAYNDVISMSVSGLYTSYLLPCSFLLWRRATGQIRAHKRDAISMPDHAVDEAASQNKRSVNFEMPFETESSDDDNSSKPVLSELVPEWGPWRLPGWLGICNNAFACVYCVWVLFWDFWPPATPVTPATMNYSVLMLGVVIIFAVAYYLLGGRKYYRGPLVDYEVRGIAGSSY